MRDLRPLARSLALLGAALLTAGVSVSCATSKEHQANDSRIQQEDLTDEVRQTEAAFAKTMQDRDFAAFGGFISSEAVFFSGPEPLRGRAAVLEGWQPFFEGAQAPFSWKPGQVEVLDSGTLALTSGPVFNPEGRQVATFTSVWRREGPGTWRIVFDKGNPVEAPAAQR